MTYSDSMRGARFYESFLTVFISLLLLFTFNGRQSSKEKLSLILRCCYIQCFKTHTCLFVFFRRRVPEKCQCVCQLGHVHGHGGHVAHDDLVLGQHGVGQHTHLLFSLHVSLRHQQRPHLGQRPVQELGERSLHHQHVAQWHKAYGNSENKQRANNRCVVQVQSEMFHIVHIVRIGLPVRREQCECDGRLGVDERCHHDNRVCDKR